jgi:hypothetical protein
MIIFAKFSVKEKHLTILTGKVYLIVDLETIEPVIPNAKNNKINPITQ